MKYVFNFVIHCLSSSSRSSCFVNFGISNIVHVTSLNVAFGVLKCLWTSLSLLFLIKPLWLRNVFLRFTVCPTYHVSGHYLQPSRSVAACVLQLPLAHNLTGFEFTWIYFHNMYYFILYTFLEKKFMLADSHEDLNLIMYWLRQMEYVVG